MKVLGAKWLTPCQHVHAAAATMWDKIINNPALNITTAWNVKTFIIIW